MFAVVMPFGKYRGWELEDIPIDYLKWAYKNIEFRSSDLEDAIEEIVESESHPNYQKEIEGQLIEEVLSVVNRWYKKVALKFHPDRGGSVEQMKLINELVSDLRQQIKSASGG